jgi:hypothetical protein
VAEPLGAEGGERHRREPSVVDQDHVAVGHRLLGLERCHRRHWPSGALRVAPIPIQFALSVTIVVRLPSFARNTTVSLPT